MSREREKEEKIFQAIGDLPDDMISDAANYQFSKKETGYFEKLLLMGKGVACAACAALIIFGLVPWIYDVYHGGSRTKTENMAVEEQKSGASIDMEYSSDSDTAVKEDKEEERKEGTLYLWSEVVEEISYMGKDRIEDSAGKETTKSGEKEKSAGREMKAGKTVRLYVMDIPLEGASGTGKKVLPFKIGNEGDGITYTIHSETANCNIASVTSGEDTRQIDGMSVDCIGGDRIELNTFERAAASWTENPAPEWDEKDINILDIIEITGKKEEKTYDFGRIIIGKKGEKYYGLLQKRDN